MQDYHRLEIWRRAMDLTVRVYRLSSRFPDSERYSLAQQLRRAATSVPLNISEGCGSGTDGEFAHFLGYGYRSLNEVATCLELGERLFPGKLPDDAQSLRDELVEIQRMTYAFMRELRRHPKRSRY